MSDKDRFEDIVRKDLDVRASDGTYDRMREIVLGAHGPARTTASAATLIFKGRTIMRNPIAKLAVAAAILIALGLGVSIFLSTGHHSGVVWAQVADRVDTSRGFSYRTRTIQSQADWGRPLEWTTMTYNCPGHGGRSENMEGPAIDSYYSFDEGIAVSLFHDMKRYTKQTVPPLPAGAVGDMPDGAMAKAMIRQFTMGAYKELGRQTIDGVEAEGIETHEPAGFGGNFQVDSRTSQLWVSVETGYPIRVESEVVGNNGTLQIKTVMDQFRWDVEFDPSEFTTEIPPDYEPLEILPGGGIREEMRGGMRGSSDSQ
jgi:hypothetical protein